MVWQQPLAAVADQLDLEAALTSTDRNDLLPPRYEDTVGGEVGKRLLDALSREVSAGRYEPERAVPVAVPKPSLTTRPAALLTITDRIVYDAIVTQLRARLDKFLVPEDTVFWPRGVKASTKRWRDFDETPKRRHPLPRTCASSTLLGSTKRFRTIASPRCWSKEPAGVAWWKP